MTQLSDYDYDLPKERIAQRPLQTRTDARLMVVDRRAESIEHYHVRDLPELLKPQDALVLNNTRVIPAKLVGYRTRTRGRWQGLYLESDDKRVARMLAKTRGKIEPGETITLQTPNGVDDVKIVFLAKLSGGAWAVRPETDAESWLDILERVGRVPLPHYIRGGQMEDEDRTTYQTVFAKSPGSVAAPTAGLHFTKDLLLYLKDFGCEITSVTLHVGIGTFRPIEVDEIQTHRMHSEWCSVSQETVERLQARRKQGGRVIAVGTTSVRTLESAAATGELAAWEGETDLFIHPPYQFHAIDGMLTNFHLPRSSLLVLVRTFGGDELIRRAYAEAIREEYRFYSYGDAMLIV